MTRRPRTPPSTARTAHWSWIRLHSPHINATAPKLRHRVRDGGRRCGSIPTSRARVRTDGARRVHHGSHAGRQTGIDLIAAVDGDMASVTADAAYDSIAFYDAAGARGAQVVVPPTKTARVSRRRPRSSARDRTIRRVKDIGRRQWKKASLATIGRLSWRTPSSGTNRFIGTGLRARTPGGQRAEALLACNILNRMTDLGGAQSRTISVGEEPLGVDRCGPVPIHAPTPRPVLTHTPCRSSHAL